MDSTQPLLNPDIRAVRQVKVLVTVGDVVIPVNQVRMMHEVNQLPFLEFSAQLDNSYKSGDRTARIGAVDLDLTKFNKLNRIAQAHVLDDFSVLPDCTVSITDGEGRTIDFIGFLGRPAFKVQGGSLSISFTVVHAKSVLQCYNGRIYQGTEFYIQSGAQALRDSNRQAGDKRALDNVADWFAGILNQLRRAYQEGENAPEREPLFDSVNALNKLVQPDLDEVLQLSRDGTFIEGLADLTNGCDGDNLYSNLRQLILGQRNLLAALYGTLDMFLFQLNATWGGKMWLEHRTMFEPYHARIQAPPISVGYDLAHTFEPPLLQVLVEGGGAELYSSLSRTGGAQFPPIATSLSEPVANDSQNIIPKLISRARYPEPLPPRGPSGQVVAGTYLIVDAPNWVASEGAFPMQVISELKQSSGNEMKDLINFYINRRKDLEVQRVGRVKILDYLAEFHYKSQFLGKTGAVVTVPLIVGSGKQAVQVGRVYRVESSASGDPMFEGYLSQVTHDIAVENDGGQATTTLVFSHVRMPAADKS